MKKLITIGFALMLSTAAFSQSILETNNSKVEIMSVEIYFLSGLTGIYVSHIDKEPEFLEMDRLLTKKKIKEQAMLVRTTFQKLYDEGWMIENSVGNPSLTRYILKRKKQ